MKPRIAVLDDETRMARVLAMVLRKAGWQAEPFVEPAAMLEAQQNEGFDALLTDLRMPQMDGLEVLEAAQAAQPGLPVVLVTAHASVKTAIAAMQKGAFGYLEKPVDNDELRALVGRALEVTRLERENRYLRAELESRYDLDGDHIVAESEGMRAVFDLTRRAARSRSTVLVGGESGTGKELVARAVHYWSDRVGRPFVAVNCKAFSAGVLESELFGHDKGAFTGADRARAGVFERADGGTLLLDEIGEVDLSFQAKLLRVLQEREVVRVGGSRPIAVDVRIVAATNRDLKADVEEGRFREDLYFRLAVIPITLPPLRERPADVLPLARLFVARYAREAGREITGWTDAVERRLRAYRWPGNVRELENVVERAVVLAPEPVITVDDLMLDDHEADAGGALSAAARSAVGLHEFLDLAAAERIKAALAETGGKKAEAAEVLGIDRTTLYRLMKKLGLT